MEKHKEKKRKDSPPGPGIIFKGNPVKVRMANRFKGHSDGTGKATKGN